MVERQSFVPDRSMRKEKPNNILRDKYDKKHPLRKEKRAESDLHKNNDILFHDRVVADTVGQLERAPQIELGSFLKIISRFLDDELQVDLIQYVREHDLGNIINIILYFEQEHPLFSKFCQIILDELDLNNTAINWEDVGKKLTP